MWRASGSKEQRPKERTNHDRRIVKEKRNRKTQNSTNKNDRNQTHLSGITLNGKDFDTGEMTASSDGVAAMMALLSSLVFLLKVTINC